MLRILTNAELKYRQAGQRSDKLPGEHLSGYVGHEVALDNPKSWRHDPFKDLVIEQAKESAAKHFDSGKVDLTLLPLDALEDVARVAMMGEKKYGSFNWQKGMEWRRILASAMRHLWAFLKGEDIDPESGQCHLAHLAIDALFALHYWKHKIGEDNRSDSNPK